LALFFSWLAPIFPKLVFISCSLAFIGALNSLWTVPVFSLLASMIYRLASISSWLLFILASICSGLASILSLMSKVHQNYLSHSSNPMMHNSIQHNNSIQSQLPHVSDQIQRLS
jgi:hypothetical protein